jgi:8-oxo-dGTP pyrophosphatase MutT (NUDIX family)
MTNATNKAAGTLLMCNDTGRFLLVKRGNEKPLVAAIRELDEETAIKSNDISYRFFEKQEDMGGEFYFFLGYCSEEFECDLSGAPGENTDWGWFDMETLPSPLFPTLKATLLRIF